MNVNWSIDLGGILTLLAFVVGFIVLTARSRTELDTLRTTVDGLVKTVDSLRMTVVRLEERVATLLNSRPPPPTA